MATIIVNTTLDENDGSIIDGDVSLRDAIAAASSGDTITFASGAGAAFETGGKIRLNAALGELVLSSDVTIDGDINDDGAPDVTMTGDTLGDDVTTTDPLGNTITDALNNDNAADNVRVFDVTGGASTLDGLVITGGLANYGKNGGGAGVLVANDAALMVRNSSVSGNANYSEGGGGGIANSGTTTLINSTVFGNEAENDGTGIYNAGTLILTETQRYRVIKTLAPAACATPVSSIPEPLR